MTTINKHKTFTQNYNVKYTKLVIFLLISIIFSIIIWYYFFKPKVEKLATTITTQILPNIPLEEEVKKKTIEYKNMLFSGPPIWLGSGSAPKILFNDAYISAYCDDRKNPLWVGYRLHKVDTKRNIPRPKKFLVDDRTKSKINPKEFTRTGFDRGHLAPSYILGLRYGPDAQIQTFLMSNITPQSPVLNRKVWTKIENLEDLYANIFNEIWVFTGPIFDDNKQYLPTGIEIPDAFFKIFIDYQEDSSNTRFLAFIVPQNVKGNENVTQFLSSIDEIEDKTKLNFFAPFSDDVENRFEAYVAKQLW